jgi:hypothetical protein
METWIRFTGMLCFNRLTFPLATINSNIPSAIGKTDWALQIIALQAGEIAGTFADVPEEKGIDDHSDGAVCEILSAIKHCSILLKRTSSLAGSSKSYDTYAMILSSQIE